MSEALDITAPELVKLGPEKGKLAAVVGRFWPEAIVVALVVLLWAPRLSGPIDLRWDGGVYYILGTSLAEGHGYRILSEPGAPEALQYPPLLPAIVALYEKALATSDPMLVGSWLRVSYAVLFLIYGLASLALAKRYLRPTFALAATGLCLLHFQTIFLSDLLFTELPFALLSVAFVLVGVNATMLSRGWLREITLFTLGAAGFLLRTAGIVLLAAWVLEALTCRRWWVACRRGALASLPLLAWQLYVAHVQSSAAYAHAAYQYQRASYQYYNVSYAENVRLRDPFRPELGRIDVGAFAKRLATTNLVALGESIGAGVSTRKTEWYRILKYSQSWIPGKPIIAKQFVIVPMLYLTAFVLVGMMLLIRRRDWLMLFIILGTFILVWTTPWPAQFIRYLMPLGCFLSICAVLALAKILGLLQNRPRSWLTIAGELVVIGTFALMFGAELYTSLRFFHQRENSEAVVLADGRGRDRLFAHERPWQDWENAAAWIAMRAPQNAIVATSAPHFLYLRTGLRAVLPPMDADPARARLLLEKVPVSFVIVESWDFLDMSRRYAQPAMESHGSDWRVVKAIGQTRIYQRFGSAK
jgi:hypothetical protein